MRMLLISDPHCAPSPYERYGDPRALHMLMRILDEERPDVVLCAGDWGENASPDEFKDIIMRSRLFTIYGNHDRIPVLRSLSNLDGTPCLLKHDEVLVLDDLRIAGVGGLLVSDRPRRGYHTKLEDALVSLKRALLSTAGSLDVLLIHEPPLTRYTLRGNALVNRLIAELRPRLVVSGHLHAGGRVFSFGGSTIVNLDTSAGGRWYSIVEVRSGDFRVELKRAPRLVAGPELNPAY